MKWKSKKMYRYDLENDIIEVIKVKEYKSLDYNTAKIILEDNTLFYIVDLYIYNYAWRGLNVFIENDCSNYFIHYDKEVLINHMNYYEKIHRKT